MKKTMKDIKKEVLGNIKNSVSALFEESKNAEQLVYRAKTGQEARECPEAFSTHMNSLMRHDAMQLSLLMKDDDKAAKAVKKIAHSIEEKDLAVRRMMDDRKDKRPVIKYPYDDTAKVIREITEMSKSGAFENTMFGDYSDYVKAWVTRLLKLDLWGYYLKAQDTLDEIISKADFRAYDENNELVYGISEDDAECVKVIAAMEQILLKALMRIPADSEEVQPTLGRIEIIEVLMKAIIDEDEEMIERMFRAAEAAKEFAGE